MSESRKAPGGAGGPERSPGEGAGGAISPGRAYVSGLLAAASLIAGFSTGRFGILAALVSVAAFLALVVYNLRAFGAGAPSFPTPHLALVWIAEVVRFLRDFVVWAAPHVPFVAPFGVFVAVTWPLARESASLRFQEQASQIILVLLVGYAIEAGAIRWRARPFNWILSVITAGILLAGEIYALVDLATDTPDHADIIAGSMAAGVVAILVTAIQGRRREGEAPDRPGANETS